MTLRTLLRNVVLLSFLTLGVIGMSNTGRRERGARHTSFGSRIWTVPHTPDVYLFAQKQAELYRGELLTRSEMRRLILRFQAYLTNRVLLEKLRANPYDLDAVQNVQATTKSAPDDSCCALRSQPGNPSRAAAVYRRSLPELIRPFLHLRHVMKFVGDFSDRTGEIGAILAMGIIRAKVSVKNNPQ